MVITTFNRVKTIARELGTTTDNSIISIYRNTDLDIGDEFLPGYKIISWNCFVKNLKAYAKITSLDPIRLPNFGLEDSETDKLYKALDTEWKSPRKQLNVFIGENGNWHPMGSVSLLNPSGYPYRVYNLIDLYTQNLAIELGSDGGIAVQLQDVGFGLLTNQDRMTIHGSCVEEIIVEHPDPLTITNVYVQGGGGITPQPPAPVTGSLLGNNSLIDNSFLIGN